MNGKTFLALLVGAALGAAGAWYYFNKRYLCDDPEPIDEEQPDLKSKVTREPIVRDEAPDDGEDGKIEYNKVVKQYIADEDNEKGPYVISREEFNDGTMPCHVTYSYFEDGILTDEYNDIVDDADEALGEEFVNHFDEDLVYIRNEQRKCDYEILREGITYHEPPDEEDKEG